ncbi:MscS Mechanosensitive ion channel [Thermovibrio ammonificans HB-1]|uniref:MscS Mechanosensitive ion channel n=1 Tax=Thermovibrio ammonificans (strain DSM 15698 / JCM 12110 / HB-1) TaxID=648996 RepID=E8T6E7_THEA1|nr:mechanosensitive ion channel domain-containing protein [Thermovibrio ammonificans]ADU96731.1 MscS Mechanosensitive ion channel [Thermovibrio ammonificans HB-1]
MSSQLPLFLREHAPFLLFILLVVGALGLELLVRRLVVTRLKERLVADAAVITVVSLALFGAGWQLSDYYKEWVFRELLRNTAILVAALHLTRAVHLLTGKRGRKKLLPYLAFIVAYLLSLFFLFPPVQNAQVLVWSVRLKKLFIFLGATAVVWEIGETLKNEFVARIFRLSSTTAMLLLFGLWEVNYLNFNFKTLIGIAIIVFLTAVFTFAYSKGIPELVKRVCKELPQQDSKVVENNLKSLLTVLYLILLVKLLSGFSNLGSLFDKLENAYLIKTDLVKISVGNIITFGTLAVILFNLLNIVKKLIKLTFPKERREVEGGSAEALIFNLGVLFNSIILLSTLGITWKVILPIAGTLGVGLGFGLQTIMNNYVSGFILLFSKKLKVGDIVELPSVSVSTLGSTSPSVFGKVEDIGILSTIIRTNDGVEISIPNSSFISSPIVNFSLKDPYVRLKIPVGVAYSSDPKEVKRLLEEVIEELPYTVRFLPKMVRFEELGDSALIFRAIFWIDVRKDMWVRNIISDFYFRAWYKLKEAGVEIPFPQNDVWFRNSLKVEIERPNLPKEES